MHADSYSSTWVVRFALSPIDTLVQLVVGSGLCRPIPLDELSPSDQGIFVDSHWANNNHAVFWMAHQQQPRGAGQRLYPLLQPHLRRRGRPHHLPAASRALGVRGAAQACVGGCAGAGLRGV